MLLTLQECAGYYWSKKIGVGTLSTNHIQSSRSFNMILWPEGISDVITFFATDHAELEVTLSAANSTPFFVQSKPEIHHAALIPTRRF